MKVRGYFILLGVICVFVWIVSVGTARQHEAVHEAIYKIYHVNSTSVVYTNPIRIFKHSIGGFTVANDTEGLCNETCLSLHAENEIVGYNVQSIIAVVFLLMLFLLLIQYVKGGITK